MSDLRLLALTVSGGFLFLGGIFLGNSLGNLLLAVGLIALLVPIVLGCIDLFRWLLTPSPAPSSSDKDKESK